MHAQVNELRIHARRALPNAFVACHCRTPILVRCGGYPVSGLDCPALPQTRYLFTRPRFEGRSRAGQRSHTERDHRNACDEKGHRGEGSKITDEISHNMAPFGYCSFFVLFLFNSQASAHETPAIHRLWLMQPRRSAPSLHWQTPRPAESIKIVGVHSRGSAPPLLFKERP
ncbi:hypothetical protein AB395_00001039 [Sinorhizobium fredii CCBAU 45436]|nr:hypothetical protein SF83666_c10090 [Sinorhizobium fredii CCBAU 83666]AWI56712.1 hypothetical protein AB395_00001039 [Sinorhizobium fredii CCBAU 45436]